MVAINDVVIFIILNLEKQINSRPQMKMQTLTAADHMAPNPDIRILFLISDTSNIALCFGSVVIEHTMLKYSVI